MRSKLAAELPQDVSALASSAENSLTITIKVSFPLRGGRRTVAAGRREAAPDQVGALRKAHAMLSRGHRRPSRDRGSAGLVSYERRILRLAFLAPDLQRDIIAGRQPAHANLEFLMKREIPVAWGRQRQDLTRRSAIA